MYIFIYIYVCIYICMNMSLDCLVARSLDVSKLTGELIICKHQVQPRQSLRRGRQKSVVFKSGYCVLTRF